MFAANSVAFRSVVRRNANLPGGGPWIPNRFQRCRCAAKDACAPAHPAALAHPTFCSLTMGETERDILGRKAYMRAYRTAYKERVRRVTLTLSPDEFSVVKRLAAAERLAVSAYLKKSAFAHGASVKPVHPDLLDRLDELVRQIRGIATNVNQMARHSNRLRAGVEDAEVMLKLRFLEQRIREFLSGANGGPR